MLRTMQERHPGQLLKTADRGRQAGHKHIYIHLIRKSGLIRLDNRHQIIGKTGIDLVENDDNAPFRYRTYNRKQVIKTH